ncbi:MAG: anti-sigma factor [Acidimicrobiales bacterium]
MMTHDEAYELLAPMALDALDADVRDVLESHVSECPRCQGELDELREVASALGTTYAAVPEGLWEKISSRLYERDGDDAAVPELAVGALSIPFDAALTRRVEISKRLKAIAATVSLVAAAAIIALGASLVNANSHVGNLQNALNKSNESAVLSALVTPGHKVITLASSTNHELARFVMLPDGRGYLISSRMPSLPGSETYQLWGIVGGKPVSIGVMGRSPSQVTFTLASSPAPSALAVTIEPSGGALTPAKTLVASGAV